MTFEQSYLDKCSELGIEPLKIDINSPTLNLSGTSLSLKSCAALCSALAGDSVPFTKIILADAFLGDDGLMV
jgi:hypothetical protein